MRNIKIIMHTHWDREWYFTCDETKVLLRNHMIEVIEFLEKNEDLIYVLDGQSVMVDDFLEQDTFYQERLRILIQKQQLRVGPWYTQSDLLLVSGESIIRNLYHGVKLALEYGPVMKVGYAPDTFGHSVQMPQIYQMFGIDSTFFWRGFSELKAQKSDFIWQGIDGTKIYGVNLATGYQGAKYLENDELLLKNRMNKIMSVLDNYSAGEDRLIMNGHDQMPIQKDIKEIMAKINKIYPEDNVQVVDFESYVTSLKQLDLEVVCGELNHCKHARIHKTINSTRMDLKLLNTELENKIYNVLEPLSLIATNIDLPYPHLLIDNCLKELFKIHAHDSIGGCNSDKVNQDIKQRLLQTKEKLDTQIELYQRLISSSAQVNEQTNLITVYNYLPYTRSNEHVLINVLTRFKHFKIIDTTTKEELKHHLVNQEVIDAGLIDRQVAARLQDIKCYNSNIQVLVPKIKGLSVSYYEIIEVTEENITNNTPTINNEYYEVNITNNKINLLNKKTNQLYEDVISIENSGDAGDSYDYSPPHLDVIYNSNDVSIADITINNNEDFHILDCTLNYILPYDQQNRDVKEVNTNVTFKLNMQLVKDDVLLNITTSNKVKDSRYRLVFKTNIFSDVVTSDSHLCEVEKPVYLKDELAIWEQDKWVEKPVSVETYQSYVQLKDLNNVASIYSVGLKEYEVVNDCIYLTLFRSFSHLGKRNLINRPGRPSGIEIETPDNQLIDTAFSINIMFNLNNEKNPALKAKSFTTPLAGYQLKEFNRFNVNTPEVLKVIDEHLDLELKELVISALKENEDKDYFIRLFNPTNHEVEVEIENCFNANVFEERIEPIKVVRLKTQEIKNLIIKKG